MNKIKGGILAAKGFKAGSAEAGIKAAGGLDLGLIWCETPATTAAIFTQNSVLAAPVQLSKQHAQTHDAQAIVVNSGNANCMTGEEGKQHAGQMVQAAAKLLGIDEQKVLVASTGIIGRPLPIDKVLSGVQAAFDQASTTAGDDFAQAITTTDTVIKTAAYECETGGKKVTIGGCSKGSGMMQPNMATMLAFLTTDAAISDELLDKALREASRTTFN